MIPHELEAGSAPEPTPTRRASTGSRPASGTSTTPSTSLESANLDLLRSAAVSFVVLFHVALYFSAAGRSGLSAHGIERWGALGHWGVLIFFVHTCLVLMQSLERFERRRPAGQSLFLEFMVRRCFRLLPLSSLTVIFVSLLQLPVGHLHNGQFFAVPMRLVDVLGNLLMLQNVTNVESVEAPLWSLPFEMEMYLVLPLLFAFVRERRDAWRAIALWAAAFAFGLVWEHHRVGAMPEYVPCFLAGVVAYKWPRRKPGWPFWLWPIVLLTITLCYLRFPALGTSWVSCLALAVAIPQFAELPEGIVRRSCHYVARYSYGIYLAHFILLWFAFARLSALPMTVRVAVFVVLLALVSVALYHLVEAPMIRVGAVVADRCRTRSLARSTSVALGTAIVIVLAAGIRIVAARRSAVLGLAATPGESAAVRLVGRFDRSDHAGPRFAWPGSAIVTNFVGTGLDVRLGDKGSNFFTIVVDGGRPTRLSTMEDAHEYALASDLPAGHHEVVLTKRTEASVGTVQYLGVTPRNGVLATAPSARPARRIEYVGDSIACGYGVLGPDATCPFSPDTEDETMGFAALAADDVGAEATVIAYSGKGMYRDFAGSTGEQMPVLFRRTLPDEPASEWTFTDLPPDAVVVSLGTNDYDQGDPGPEFERTYAKFLRELRQDYPAAHVICTLSPMLSDSGPDRLTRRTLAASAIQAAVKEQRGTGDARVTFLAFDEQDPSAGLGCEGHPSPKTQRVMADKLADALRRLMGW